jgi:hypothetical protein
VRRHPHDALRPAQRVRRGRRGEASADELLHRSPPLLIGLEAMDATRQYKFIRFEAMYVTKPYEFIGFGAMDATKPYKLGRFGAMDATKPYKFIGLGAMARSR